MIAFALLLLVGQDSGSDFAKRSREFFEPLLDVKSEEGDLVFVRACTDEALDAAFDRLWDVFEGVDISYAHGHTSGSGGGGGEGGSVNLRFEPGGKKGVFYFDLAFPGGRGSIEIRQDGRGRFRMVAEQPDGTIVIFLQTPGSGCSLFACGAKEPLQFHAKSFDELASRHPERVSSLLLEPVGKYFDEVPLTTMSPDVIDFALALRPLDPAAVTELEEGIARLEDDALEVRESMTKELRERALKDSAIFHFLAVQRDRTEGAEAKQRLRELLRAVPRREEAHRYVVERGLYRDLEYLARLMSSGRPVRERLEALTGQTLETAEAWTAWVKENAANLKWDETAWRYVPAGSGK